MAHFAKISENNEVLTVLTLNNVDMHNADGVEDETVGQQYLEKHNNWPAQMWIQTSYNTINNTHKDGGTAFRGNYAAIGYIWDEDNQIFWPKKPYASWVKNTTTVNWDSPIGAAPELTAEQTADETNRYHYNWNESGQSWDLVTTVI
jgi:hypothetical protein|tara:strand:+ start:375 stop:815 length:441 start_codon:yes stop_codon:yes gene_type:complete